MEEGGGKDLVKRQQHLFAPEGSLPGTAHTEPDGHILRASTHPVPLHSTPPNPTQPQLTPLHPAPTHASPSSPNLLYSTPLVSTSLHLTPQYSTVSLLTLIHSTVYLTPSCSIPLCPTPSYHTSFSSIPYTSRERNELDPLTFSLYNNINAL